MAAFFAGEVIIEQHENFIKQTYRNRAIVPSAEKILTLSIPVNRNNVHNCPVEQVEIDYSQSWQREHWRTLETIYNASPFFLYYKDYL
ncbi:MAG: WbqC family protein [Bacteroidales bacterium]|nr:WbqC family protein [Bacteroidales bacterium]